MKATEFDKRFDDAEDIDSHIDWAKARRPGLEIKRVNVDFPAWVVTGLDQEAQRLGVTRQSLIKIWIAEKLGLGGESHSSVNLINKEELTSLVVSYERLSTKTKAKSYLSSKEKTNQSVKNVK